MANAQDRAVLISRIGKLLVQGDPEAVKEARDLVANEGPALGRARRWKDACAWLLDAYEEANGPGVEDPDRHRHWAVLQGMTFMVHASN